ncbi:glucokinase [Microvirga sp. M2]|uniref:glucokinase n=1 Tax=Microvirga sp. M2 TaxID=3073270 RepID=UPI0039C28C8F
MFTFPVLIGDIGGTTSRFAILPCANGEVPRLVVMPTASHETPTLAIRSALVELGGQPPRSAFLGIAGRVGSSVVSLTNASWTVDAERIGIDMGLLQVTLVNDYVPVAAATLVLDPRRVDELVPIAPVLACGTGARLAVGSGTGLGVSACIPVGRRHWLQSTEAGHINFGACAADELATWPYIDRLAGRITAEAVLSGPGLVRLYGAIARRTGALPVCEEPADVIARAVDREERAAPEAARLFASLLGRFAGDLALILGTTGGVFFGGGIPRRILGLLGHGELRTAFDHKAPFEAVMRKTPTFIITHPEPGMMGLAMVASAPEQFIFESHGWASPEACVGGDPR